MGGGTQLDNVEIWTVSQYLISIEDLCEWYKRALTLDMIDEQHPDTSWTQVYTDGSGTNAVEKEGLEYRSQTLVATKRRHIFLQGATAQTML